jgi:undecaprenyl-diphosphatase
MTYQALNHLDAYFIQLTNSIVGRSVLFDKAINCVFGNQILTALFVGAFCACWFSAADATDKVKIREHLLASLWAALAGFMIARTLALELPFRLRPRFDPAAHFRLPASGNGDMMDWSSFPSDHAVMYWALAMGLCFVSIRLGLVSMLYVIGTVCIPRMYLGYHYFTDIFAGIVIGSLCAIVFNLRMARRLTVRPVLSFESSWPRTFYTGLFFVTFQFATMFDSLRTSASMGYHFVEHILARG